MKHLFFLAFVLAMTSGCAHKELVHSDGTPSTPVEAAEDKAIKQLPGTPAADLDSGADINHIDVEINLEVEKWIEYFQGRGRGYFERYLERSTRYVPVMKKILKDNGVPEDLIYIAMIESGFSAKIKSRAKAVGFWQFIGATGKHYGLKVNNLVDERYDPVKSTEAAAKYFKGLYNLFYNWFLAIASYNVGENRIKTVVMKNFTRDFWELARRKQLPAETQQYIPKFLAARLIANEPEKYGFVGLNYEPPMEFDMVTASDPVDMRALAKAMKIDYDEIKDLNPAYKSQYAPAVDGVASIRVPKGTAEAAKLVMNDAVVKNKRLVATASSSRSTYTRYRVKRGDNLSSIAERFDISVDEIVKHNRIHKNHVRPGQTLRIPSSAFNVEKERKTYTHRQPSALPPLIYVVKRGDTLTGIARRHDVSLGELLKNNKQLAGGKVLRGQKVKIPRAVASADNS
jgi:membrane-bound lytic murein transglycosylase D